MHELKQPLGGVHRKKVLLKGDEWYIDDDKNILKLLEIRLLGFLLFGVQGDGIQVSLSSWEINFRPTVCQSNKNAVPH